MLIWKEKVSMTRIVFVIWPRRTIAGEWIALEWARRITKPFEFGRVVYERLKPLAEWEGRVKPAPLTFPNRPVMPTKPATFGHRTDGSVTLYPPHPKAADDEALRAGRPCLRHVALHTDSFYACACHQRLGNDYFFLPSKSCLYEPADPLSDPASFKGPDEPVDWSERHAKVAAELRAGPPTPTKRGAAADAPDQWSRDYDVT